MVFFNYSTMQMAAKVVYYGPGLCGKTTNLHHVYSKTSSECRGEMVSLETETDRTLFFDLLPIDVGQIAGFNTRIQLYTVPGQVFYNTTRKLVLKGVDGVVFVADSQRAMLEANVDSLANLETNLAEMGLSLAEVPLVFQYNKRDLDDICTVEELDAALNPEGRPHFEAVAIRGDGVFETLQGISKLTLLSLRDRLSGSGAATDVAPAAEPGPAAEEPETAAEELEAATGEPEPAAAVEPEPTAAEPRPVAVPAPTPLPPTPSRPAAVAEAAPRPAPVAPAPAPGSSTPAPGPRRLSERDVFDELERLRRQAIRPFGRGAGDGGGAGSGDRSRGGGKINGVTATNGANGAGALHRDIRLTLPRETLERARRLSVTVAVEDGEQRVVETIRNLEVDVAEDSSKLLLRLAIDAAPES